MSISKGTIVVTGANGALGSAIAEQIASKPELSACHGVYTVRDAAAAPALTSALGDSSHPHDVLSLDLTSLENVRQVAESINVRRTGAVPPVRTYTLTVTQPTARLASPPANYRRSAP